MSLTKIILKYAAPVPKIESFQRYLFVGPHPDDIEIGAGGAIAALRKMGKEISFVICTDGRYGMEHAPSGTTPEELIEIRKQESIASAKVLASPPSWSYHPLSWYWEQKMVDDFFRRA